MDARGLRLWTAGFQVPRSRRLSRPAHSAKDGGGRRRFGGVASKSTSQSVANLSSCFSGLAFAMVLWETVMVVLARGPGCPSRHEPARSQGFADKFPNELARVRDSVGKSPAWRGLDAAFPSHFIMLLEYRPPASGI